MAGYFLYSLDEKKVTKFLNEPTSQQIERLTKYVSDELDELDSEIADSDLMASWPSKLEELAITIAAHCKKADWYDSLNAAEKSAWENCMRNMFEDDHDKSLGFRFESEEIYWNMVDATRTHHKIPLNKVLESELSFFGRRPLRFGFTNYAKLDAFELPMHSIHSVAQTKTLRDLFEQAESTVRACPAPEAESDYETIMETLDRVIDNNRMLFVSTDT